MKKKEKTNKVEVKSKNKVKTCKKRTIEKTKKDENYILTKRNLLLVILIILLMGGLIVGLNYFKNGSNKKKDIINESNKVNESNIKYNTNENFIKDKVSGDISFTNIECVYDGENSLLKYTITNNGDTNVKLNEYEVVVKDKNEEVLAVLVTILDEEIAPKKSYEAGNAIDIDLTDAYILELNLLN